MATINLLPWRAELREDLKRRFFLQLGCAVILSLFVVFIIHLLLSARLNNYHKKNMYLQHAIAKYGHVNANVAELTQLKQHLEAQIDRIQYLTIERDRIVRIFDDIVQAIPPGVFLTSMKWNQFKLTLAGKADLNIHVSEMMHLIEKSFSFSHVLLAEIQIDEKGNAKNMLSDFVLDIQMQPTNK